VRTEGDKRPCLVLVGGRAGYGREAAEWASRLARKRYSQKALQAAKTIAAAPRHEARPSGLPDRAGAG
jgi:hypothetical protein